MDIAAIVKLVEIGLIAAESVAEWTTKAREMGEAELAEALDNAEARAAINHARNQAISNAE